jgi:hypothetical protein
MKFKTTNAFGNRYMVSTSLDSTEKAETFNIIIITKTEKKTLQGSHMNQHETTSGKVSSNRILVQKILVFVTSHLLMKYEITVYSLFWHQGMKKREQALPSH